MHVISRAEWGAQHGRGTELRGAREGVVIHHFGVPDVACGAGGAAEIRAIQGVERHHAEVNGWAGIGYHWIVCQSGRIFEGRGWERIGAHASGHNETTYGIALAIDGQQHEPTKDAIDSVRWLIEDGVRLGYIATDYTLQGHRDVGSTTCPGDLVYAMLEDFRPEGA